MFFMIVFIIIKYKNTDYILCCLCALKRSSRRHSCSLDLIPSRCWFTGNPNWFHCPLSFSVFFFFFFYQVKDITSNPEWERTCQHEIPFWPKYSLFINFTRFFLNNFKLHVCGDFVMNMCCVSWSILLQIVWSFGQIRKCCWQEKKKRSDSAKYNMTAWGEEEFRG